MQYKTSIKDLILEYINQQYPDLVTSKELRRMLKQKHKIDISSNDLYVYVYRLYKPRKGKPLIKKAGRGLYKGLTTIDNIYKLEDPPVELHGIKIEARLADSNLQKRMEGITSVQVSFLVAAGFNKTTNKRYTRRDVFEGRMVTLTVHESGFIEVFINASREPLDCVTFQRIVDTVFNGYLRPLGVICDKKIRQADIARDFLRLKLDGVKSVSLKAFSNAWFKIYHKNLDMGTRIETRLVHEMDLADAIKTLQDLTVRPYTTVKGEDGVMYG